MTVDEEANVENLRRLFVKMSRDLKLRKEDETLIDLVNHADAIAQQLQGKEISFDIEPVTYGEVTIWLEEGSYSKQNLIYLVDCFNLMEERTKDLTKELANDSRKD